MQRHSERNEQSAESVPEMKRSIAHAVLYYTILSKNTQNNFQNLLFKKLLAQSGDQTDIFWKFFSPAGTFWLPKTIGQVLGYITEFAGVISGGCATLCANNSTDPFVLELSSLVESHTPSIAFGSAVLILSSSGPFLFEYSNLL